MLVKKIEQVFPVFAEYPEGMAIFIEPEIIIFAKWAIFRLIPTAFLSGNKAYP
jgi:hypothetical protein